MNKKRIERIATIGLASILGRIFCLSSGLRDDYGAKRNNERTRSNGTWATITAPPGTKVGNITITNGSISARLTVPPPPGSTVNNSLAIDPKDKDALYGEGNNLLKLGNSTGLFCTMIRL